MMDIIISPNFLLGILGALITLYLSKQVVIPELRPLYDTSDTEAEAGSLRTLTADARQRITTILDQLPTDAPHFVELKPQLDGLEAALKSSQRRLEVLERRLMLTQVTSRGLGFVIFVLLGGVIAYILSGRVTVTGFQGTLPHGLQAIGIGASWTGFLSVFGIRNFQEAATNHVDAAKDSTIQQISALKAGLDEIVRPSLGPGQALVPFSAQPALASKISDRIDVTLRNVTARFDEAKARLREDARRVI